MRRKTKEAIKEGSQLIHRTEGKSYAHDHHLLRRISGTIHFDRMADNMKQTVDPRLTKMFEAPEEEVGVASTYTIFVEPQRPVTKNDEIIEFAISHASDVYRDLMRTELYVKGKLQRRDGSSLQPDEKVVLSNNILHSLFDAVTVYMGHNLEQLQCNNHPYKALIRQLMTHKTYSPTLRNSGMEIEFQSNMFKNDFEVGSARFSWTQESKTVEFQAPTLIDVFQTEGYLIPGCPLTVKYRRSKDCFYVVTDADNKHVEYCFDIEKIGLVVPCIKVSPAIFPLLDMQTSHTPALYHFDSLGMRQYNLSAGTLDRSFPKIFEGKLPSRIMVAFYPQDAFSGQRDKSPLLTAPLDVCQMSLSVNGIIARTLDTNFDDDLFMGAYKHFMDWIGATGHDSYMHYDIFKSGYRYFSFDLLEGCPESLPCGMERLQSGHIDLHVRFEGAVDKEYIMAVFFESPDVVEITDARAAIYKRSVE